MRTTLFSILIVVITVLGCFGAGCTYSAETYSAAVDTLIIAPVHAQDYTPLYTQSGTRVTIAISGVSVTFAEVVTSGYTSIVVWDDNPSGALPPGVCALSPFIDATTTASYIGPIDVSLVYNDTIFNVSRENDLKLLYWDGTGWDEATMSVDTVHNVVYGQTPALAPFCIGQNDPSLNPLNAPLYLMALLNMSLGLEVPGADLTHLGGDVVGDLTTIVHGITTVIGQLFAWILSPPS